MVVLLVVEVVMQKSDNPKHAKIKIGRINKPKKAPKPTTTGTKQHNNKLGQHAIMLQTSLLLREDDEEEVESFAVEVAGDEEEALVTGAMILQIYSSGGEATRD